MFKRVIPKFPAANVEKAVAFYEQRLQFKRRYVVADYGIASREDFEIQFWHCADKRIAENTGVRVEVDAVEPLYAECGAAGIIHPNDPLHKTDFGTHEFSVLDLDGNLITFFERVK